MDGTKREATRRRLLGRTLGLGVVGPLAVLHAACAGGESQPAASQEPVTLLMVNSGAIPPGWGDLGQAFTREYPRVTVEFTGTEGGSWGQYFEKVAVMSASGAPPDVARVAIEG